jgi:glycogen debranching enzyme
VPERTVSVLDGSTFVVGNHLGDVRADEVREHGLFSEDTRFVSRLVLRVGTVPLELLGINQDAHFAAQFFLTPAVGPDEQAPCSIIRRRLVDHVWIEEVTVTNHLHTRSRLPVALEIDTDFADLFEVKDDSMLERTIDFTDDEGCFGLAYASGDFQRSVSVQASHPGEVTRRGFAYILDLAPGEQWSSTFTVIPHAAQRGISFQRRAGRGTLKDLSARKSAELQGWLDRAPRLGANDPALTRTYRASLTDLAALRLHLDLSLGATLPAAGLPWFMALFGRDSLITSFQALPYLPELAATTLRALAANQAEVRDDFQEREPGKILHELRLGELTARGDRPHSPYFGTADATPLFLVLLDEYHRWSADDALVQSLEPNARAALDWIDDSGDIDGDGYVEYERRNASTGLLNQCWKDSWDALQFANGELAHGPIATCEIQGYVYDARRRCARLAREVWDDAALAQRLERQADALRERFHRDFWMPERGCHALALDGNKRQVDSLSSNIGHLLWSGMLDEETARLTAQRLLGEELYSGWGIRTLGASEAGYNPLGYHTGTVWPHDNSLIAAGLARYGHREAAAKIALSILTAAPYFEYRLPEVFAGFPASLTSVPVAYPTASRPQAWAAGAPLLLLSTLLDLRPGFADASAELPGGLGAVSLQWQRLSSVGPRSEV